MTAKEVWDHLSFAHPDHPVIVTAFDEDGDELIWNTEHYKGHSIVLLTTPYTMPPESVAPTDYQHKHMPVRMLERALRRGQEPTDQVLLRNDEQEVYALHEVYVSSAHNAVFLEVRKEDLDVNLPAITARNAYSAPPVAS